MDHTHYASTEKWFLDASAAGFRPNTGMMNGIDKTMQRLNMSFPEAFAFLEKYKKIILADRTYIFNLNYEGLFDLTKKQLELLLKYQPLPCRKTHEWAGRVTGKPSGEFFMQTVFWLTEIEGLDHQDATAIASASL